MMLAELNNNYGKHLYKAKKYSQALAYFSKAINNSPNTPTYYGNRAACFMMLNSFEEALEDVRKTVQLDPNYLKGYIRMIKCGIATGDIVIAKYALKKVQELQKDISVIANEVELLEKLKHNEAEASKAYKEGDFKKVVICMERCLEVASTCEFYKIVKAECLVFLGRYQDAQEITGSILELNSRNPDAMYIQGLCLYYEGKLDCAIKNFRHVLKLAPEHSKAMDICKRAKMLQKKKEEGNKAYRAYRFQEACKLYTDALEIDPLNRKTNSELYFNRATVLSSMKKTFEAIDDFTSAIKLDGTYQKALLRRAKCFMDLEEFDDAARDYEKVCEMDDNEENKNMLEVAKFALMLASMERKDYYYILGVDRRASHEKIKKFYKKMALLHHPDRHAKSTEYFRKLQERKFKEIGEAYAVLSDAKARALYDLRYTI
ncbi:unnamed protein product [Phaedon cochleariae]|uniref:J domain-containing protein n=1 Tax=Phaedon cochleariae TaxID=80249 RepID=A0A9P0GTH7_PHACE|nr:unnamed protein product [Phaedon cochleariae]